MLIKASDCNSCHLILAQGSGEQLKKLNADGYTFFPSIQSSLSSPARRAIPADRNFLEEARNAQCRSRLFDSKSNPFPAMLLGLFFLSHRSELRW